MHNKIRVVRRQVQNRRNSRLTRLLTAHKRQSQAVKGTLSRENSTGSLSSKKVIEPHMKAVYGSVPKTSLSASPEHHFGGDGENQPLLNNNN